MISRTLLIYAKPPIMGLSKTRLARGLGVSEALRIARWTTARSIRAANDSRWQTVLYVAPDRYLHATLGGLWPASLPRMSQGHGDLADRMNKGISEAPPGAVLIIGTDIPDITSELIWQGFRRLRTHDVVFGPAMDGGFWLFGMNKQATTCPPFGNVRWSGPHAMADVRRQLPADLRVAALPARLDIDDAEDWQAWQRQKNQ